MYDRELQVMALSSPPRLKILQLLVTPAEHFSHQESADPTSFGVCMNLISERIEVSQPLAATSTYCDKQNLLRLGNIGSSLIAFVMRKPSLISMNGCVRSLRFNRPPHYNFEEAIPLVFSRV